MEGGALIFVILVVLLLIYWIYLAVQKPEKIWLHRVVKAVLVVFLIVLSYALFYQFLMDVYEGKEKTYVQSVQVVIESITTAGYGGDSPWRSDVMNFMVLVMNLTGVVLVFFALPMFLVPLLREALKPTMVDKTYKNNHVIICSHSRRAAVLEDELDSKRISYLVIDGDRETVLQLNKEGIDAIHGNPADEAVLKAANIEDARCIITDFDDESNSIIALTARHLRENIQIITVASTNQAAQYHRYAGADKVINPRKVLGKGLAEKVIVNLASELQGITKIGDQLEIAEILVETGSKMDGQPVRDSELQDIKEIDLLGIWFSGEFEPNPKPDQLITGDTILLLSGTHEMLKEVRKKTSSAKQKKQEVVIAGYGLVGKTVKKYLDENKIVNRIADITESEEVDILGDITDESLLKREVSGKASTMILALNNDATAVYATLILKHLAPDVEIIARANEPESAAKLYRAGADYVLNLSTVSGRMLFSSIVKSDIILSSDTNYEVIRTKAPKLIGLTVDPKQIRKLTGSTIVMIKRDGESITNFSSDLEIEERDELIIAGSDETINQFRSFYC